MDAKQKHEGRARRHRRVRKKIHGTSERPRMAVYRSNRHIYVQLIDDVGARTITAASDAEVTGSDKTSKAKAVGELVARKANDAGVKAAVFDRGGRLYHGRVAAVAEGAREGGLSI